MMRAADFYHVLAASVVPRPIAWVSTLGGGNGEEAVRSEIPALEIFGRVVNVVVASSFPSPRSCA
ncbi:hypothetical protein [Gordonia sputi]|uniref:hypothetical protein n=1 Tax=Gordonia sputi TaxID=36823 RepID=UPI0028AF9205|nr:hypothetical protein [Gordonia sputi]